MQESLDIQIKQKSTFKEHYTNRRVVRRTGSRRNSSTVRRGSTTIRRGSDTIRRQSIGTLTRRQSSLDNSVPEPRQLHRSISRVISEVNLNIPGPLTYNNRNKRNEEEIEVSHVIILINSRMHLFF